MNTDIAVRNRNYHTTMGNHMPYGITQCYLPPSSGDFQAFTRDKVGTRFTLEGCKAELTWVVACQRRSPVTEITGQCHGWELNP